MAHALGIYIHGSVYSTKRERSSSFHYPSEVSRFTTMERSQTLPICRSHIRESDAKVIKNNQSLGTPGKYLHLISEFNKNLRQLRLKINQNNFLDLTDTRKKRINYSMID